MQKTQVTRTTVKVRREHLPADEWMWVQNVFGNKIALDDDIDDELGVAELDGQPFEFHALPTIVEAARAAGADVLEFTTDGPFEPDWPTYPERTHRYVECINNYPPMEPWERDSFDTLERYCLIEENVRGGYWLTTVATLADAADSVDNQEYAEDWEVVELVDLDTGDPYDATVTKVTTFTKKQ